MQPEPKLLAHMKPILFFAKVVTVLVAMMLLSGCSKKPGAGRFDSLSDYMKQQDQLTDGYLHGNAAQARKSLEQMVQYYSDPKTKLLAAAARAQMLDETYRRLCLLETRSGNAAEADAALAKAREWRLKFYRLANVSEMD